MITKQILLYKIDYCNTVLRPGERYHSETQFRFYSK